MCYYRIIFALLLPLFFVSALQGKDQFIILSGGGTPVNNHYSQYIQTRTLFDGLRQSRVDSPVQVFFGAGNQPGQFTVADVHAVKKNNQGKYHELLPGIMQNNRAATRASFLNFFNEPKVQDIKPEDRVFLFVSDHGLPNRDDIAFQNNCILLWHHRPGFKDDADWHEKCLSRRDLQDVLNHKIKARRIVFSMSQCFSGGFQRMAVSRRGGYPHAAGRICGFTSTTPDSIASGCVADVEDENYQGYERYFTEQLTGKNVVTGAVTHSPLKSVRDAHQAATLQDMTLDLPLSSTDYFLLDWEKILVDRKMPLRTKVLNRGQMAMVFNRVRDMDFKDQQLLNSAGKLSPVAQSRLAFIRKMAANIAAAEPGLETRLLLGPSKPLEEKYIKIRQRMRTTSIRMDKMRRKYGKLRRQNLFPHWFHDIKKRRLSLLTLEEQETFEQSSLAKYEYKFGSRANFKSQLRELFIIDLSRTMVRNPSQAKRYSQYFSNRESKIWDWINSSQNPDLIKTAARLRRIESQANILDRQQGLLSTRSSLIFRIILMRRQLAVLAVLGALKDEQAIKQYKGLEDCESTEF